MELMKIRIIEKCIVSSLHRDIDDILTIEKSIAKKLIGKGRAIIEKEFEEFENEIQDVVSKVKKKTSKKEIKE